MTMQVGSRPLQPAGALPKVPLEQQFPVDRTLAELRVSREDGDKVLTFSVNRDADVPEGTAFAHAGAAFDDAVAAASALALAGARPTPYRLAEGLQPGWDQASVEAPVHAVVQARDGAFAVVRTSLLLPEAGTSFRVATTLDGQGRVHATIGGATVVTVEPRRAGVVALVSVDQVFDLREALAEAQL